MRRDSCLFYDSLYNRMNNKITIWDVADAAGVSISTVHHALNNKSGVSQATRERIQQIADSLGYKPNKIASGLKRRTQRVAILLPGEQGNNQYYYPPLWQGVRDYLRNAADWNFECLEFSFPDEKDPTSSDGYQRFKQVLSGGDLDGLLVAGHIELSRMPEWEAAVRNGISVVQVGFTNPRIPCLCCVQPNYDIIGRTMAELVLNRITEYGSIVLCAGNPDWEQHAQIVDGFESYMRDNNAHNQIYKDYSINISEEAQQNILSLVEKPDAAACCSVLSQSSVMIARALRKSGKSKRLFAVGNDIFKENIDNLQEGVLNNLVQKNPYMQGYLGIKTLIEYLVQSIEPERKTIYVGSDVVFRSNVDMYNQDYYRVLLQ